MVIYVNCIQDAGLVDFLLNPPGEEDGCGGGGDQSAWGGHRKEANICLNFSEILNSNENISLFREKKCFPSFIRKLVRTMFSFRSRERGVRIVVAERESGLSLWTDRDRHRR